MMTTLSIGFFIMTTKSASGDLLYISHYVKHSVATVDKNFVWRKNKHFSSTSCIEQDDFLHQLHYDHEKKRLLEK